MESEATLSTVRQKIRRELDRLEERVAAYVRGNPTVSYKKIAERYGVSAGYVHKAAKKHGISRAVGRKKGWSPRTMMAARSPAELGQPRRQKALDEAHERKAEATAAFLNDEEDTA